MVSLPHPTRAVRLRELILAQVCRSELYFVLWRHPLPAWLYNFLSTMAAPDYRFCH